MLKPVYDDAMHYFVVYSLLSRPKENEKVRDELEKAVHIIWNCRLPSPRVRMTTSFILLFGSLLSLDLYVENPVDIGCHYWSVCCC